MPASTAVLSPAKKKRSSIKTAETVCAIQVRAKVLSLSGGIVLSLALLFTIFFIAAFVTERMVAGQELLFGLLMLMSWTYLFNSSTEKLSLVGDTIQLTSALRRVEVIRLDDLQELLLIHEGLNMNIGIESVTARYRNGREDRLPLGPCWRRTELESFLSSVEQELGNRKLLEEVR